MSVGSRVTFEDIDPVVVYSPYGHGSPSGGWETVFPSGQFVDAIGSSKQGQGNSLHHTVHNGAELSFEFFGTSVTLFGTAGKSKYNVQLDGQQSQPFNETDRVLASFTGLPRSQHTIKLTVAAAGDGFSFDRATFDVGMDSTWSNVTIPARDKWSYSLEWFDLTVQPAIDTNQQVRVTNYQDATAQLEFKGTAVYLFGNILFDHGLFSVTLDGEATQVNGSAHGLVQHTLLYFRAGLDPSASHVLTMRNLETKYLDVESAVVMSGGLTPGGATTSTTPPPSDGTSIQGGIQDGPSSAPSTSSSAMTDASSLPHPPPSSVSSPKSSTGAIIGGAVGGIAVATIFVLAFLIFMMRRRRGSYNSMNPTYDQELEPKPYVLAPARPAAQVPAYTVPGHLYGAPGVPTVQGGAQTWDPYAAPPSVVPSRTDESVGSPVAQTFSQAMR